MSQGESTAAGPFDQPRSLPPRRWDVALVIAVGGAVGGAARWAMNEAIPPTPGRFPWSTFIENVAGCLLLAALLVLLVEVLQPHRYVRPFLGVGVLGGFTTFSTYTNDARLLLADGYVPTALVYLVATLVAGLLATWLGLTLARAATGMLAREGSGRNA
jgi:CrcB protein